MTDHNTSEAVIEIQAGDSIVDGFSEPFLSIPKWITEDPELDVKHRYLYAVLVDWVRFGRKTGKGAFPSRSRLAAECGCSVDAITDWLKKLNERQWVTWQRRPNTSSIFWVWGPDPLSPSHGNSGNGKLPVPEGGNGKLPVPEMANCHSTQNKITKNNNKEHVSNPPTPQGGNGSVEDPVTEYNRIAERDTVRHMDQQPQAQLNRSATETPAGRVSNEMVNPWWQEGGRQKVFDFLYGKYPKMSPVVEAKIAMRLTLGEQIDDPDFVNRVWHGMQWWISKWQKEGTEDRYIPAMGRWIERRQWEQAQINPGTLAGVSS